MHHRKIGRKFNRKSDHVRAMFRNMVCALLNYESIKTTVAKAKELRRVVEPLITRSRMDNIKNRRLVFAKIRNNEMVTKLFRDLGPYFLNRSGGYTRILKCGMRVGDRAPIAYIQLVNREIKNNKKMLKK